jgi:hypothetical protein
MRRATSACSSADILLVRGGWFVFIDNAFLVRSRPTQEHTLHPEVLDDVREFQLRGFASGLTIM